MPGLRPLLLLVLAGLVLLTLAPASGAEAVATDGVEVADDALAPPAEPPAPARVARALAGGPAIASVSPPIASAGTGTTVTILGSGFGSSGSVHWVSGGADVAASPDDIDSWSDTEIRVRVPSRPGPGGVRETASSGGIRVVTDANATSTTVPFSVSFGDTGRRWAESPVFAVNDNCPGVAGGADAVRRAAATWNAALPGGFQIDCSGTSTNTTAAWDGESLIAWGPQSSLSYRIANGSIVEADIILPTSLSWTTGAAGGSTFSIESVALRNLGFCLGLAWLAGADPQGPSDAFKACCPYRKDELGNMNLVTLSPADRAGAAHLYGGASANPPLLAAAFGADPIVGPAPLTVRFADASLGGATGWSWAFGDGGTATAQNPVHVYPAPGTYTVALAASAPGVPGETIMAVQRITVTGAAVTVIPGGAGVPTSTANDGRCDDVNGNGRKDFADVVLFFTQMTWIAGNEPVPAFDYSDNGRIDFGDVVRLFAAL